MAMETQLSDRHVAKQCHYWLQWRISIGLASRGHNYRGQGTKSIIIIIREGECPTPGYTMS